MRTSLRLLLLVVVAIVVAACGATSTNEPTDTGEPTATVEPIDTTTSTRAPLPTTRLLLRFDATGGFVPVEFALTELTDFTLYSDGRVIVGLPADGFPMPAVRQYAETSLDEQTLVEVLGFIDQLGIASFDNEANNEMQNIVADAETTVVEYFDEEGGVHTYSVYALGMNDFDGADARVAVMKRLSDLVYGLDTSTATPIPIDRLQVWVSEVTPDPSFHKTRAWEFAFPTIQADGDGFPYSCFTLTGDDVANAVALLATADSTTLWEEGGSAYSVLAKPLLEGEPGCEDGF